MFYDRQLNRLTSISEGIAHVWFWSLHSVFSVMFESGLVCLFQLACLETQLQWGTRQFFQIRMTCPHHAKSMSLLRHVFPFLVGHQGTVLAETT